MKAFVAVLFCVPHLAIALEPHNVSNSGVLPWTESEYLTRYARWQALTSEVVESAELPSTCDNDLRSHVPDCTQFGSMWCWATAVAAFTEFYTSKGPAQCRGLECEIVGWCPKPPHCSSGKAQCCPLATHQDCGGDGANPSMIVEAATHFTGHRHEDLGGPMPQAALDKDLEAGKPVMMLVGQGQSATHVVWLRGCGGGKYYFWDPEWSDAHGGVYPKGSDSRSYSELLTFTYPNGYVLKWLDTVHRA